MSVEHPRSPALSATERELAELPELPNRPRRPRKLMLIGAGLAHLQILKWWRNQPIRQVELTLVSPFPQAVHSGMLPSVLAGLMPAKEMQIDLAQLTRRCGAELVIDKVIGIDLETQTLELGVFPERNFDVVSINLEAGNQQEQLCQSHRTSVPRNPFATFLSRWEARWQEQRQQMRQFTESERPELMVVGAGATGAELAMCLAARSRREHGNAHVSLIDAQQEILPGFAPRTIRLVRNLLRKRGIAVHLGTPVIDCDDDGPSELVLQNGRRLRADLVIWAAGPAPPGLLRGYSLPLSSTGFLAVRPTFQSTAGVPIFAVGDVADLVARPCPKSAAYAIQQAPVLWENLQRWFRGEPLIEYEPQPNARSLLTCGDGTAILNYRGIGLRGRWAYQWKQYLDRKFVEQFR